MKELCTWFLEELPGFLLAEPVCYFVGFALGFVILALIRDMLHLNNR